MTRGDVAVGRRRPPCTAPPAGRCRPADTRQARRQTAPFGRPFRHPAGGGRAPSTPTGPRAIRTRKNGHEVFRCGAHGRESAWHGEHLAVPPRCPRNAPAPAGLEPAGRRARWHLIFTFCESGGLCTPPGYSRRQGAATVMSVGAERRPFGPGLRGRRRPSGGHFRHVCGGHFAVVQCKSHVKSKKAKNQRFFRVEIQPLKKVSYSLAFLGQCQHRWGGILSPSRHGSLAV